jgi:hypothetical protein
MPRFEHARGVAEIHSEKASRRGDVNSGAQRAGQLLLRRMLRRHVLAGFVFALSFACGGGGCGGKLGVNEGAPCDASLYDRSCVTDADCGTLNHQIDCCGNQVVIGLTRRAIDAAQMSEAECVAATPACQCASRQPVTQDGQEVFNGEMVKVHCRVGLCGTSIQ